MKSSPVEQAYWDTIHTMLSARRVQSETERSLDEGTCPPQLGAIWDAHAKAELFSAVEAKVERALRCRSLTREDTMRKLSLLADFVSWELSANGRATIGEAETPGLSSYLHERHNSDAPLQLTTRDGASRE